MKFIALKTSDGKKAGRIKFYCKALSVTRQGFYKYLKNRDKPRKYAKLEAEIKAILNEDKYNDTYGRIRLLDALRLRLSEEELPSQRTLYRIMESIGLSHHCKRKPNSLTKADKEAQKSDDKLKRDFYSDEPNKKTITDITEIKGKDGKIYIAVIFDCFDLMVLGLAMDTNMKASLCERVVQNACELHPDLSGAILHSDRGSQYTSELYRNTLAKYGIIQSMNSAGGRCHDNARCESMWARMKEELFYCRGGSEQYTMAELKVIIWRYYMSYWNNRRICSAIGGMPPALKRRNFFQSRNSVA